MIRYTLAAFLIAAPAFAADAPKAAPAAKPAAPKIQFADFKGVKSWKKGGDNIVYVQASNGDWYKAVLLETCMSLDTSKGVNFSTQTDPDTDLKESKVVVDRHICTVDTLTKVDGPPK